MIKERFRPHGIFTIEVFEGRYNKETDEVESTGKLISSSKAENVVTNQGLDSILNVALHAATQITAWYCILYEDDTAGAAAQTYAVPVWTETTSYDEGTRPAYTEAEASSQSVTNSANKAVFTASATKTFYGAAIVGGGTDGDTKDDQAGGGTLLCAGKFSTAQPVIDGNVVNLTYTISAADA